MVFNESTAKLVVFSSLGFGAVANLFAILSCDLVEYDVPSDVGGTLGLYRYGLDNMEDCLKFSNETTEDSSFGPARAGAVAALGLAICLLALNAFHYSVRAIPHKDTLFYVIGACMQISLSLIYSIWRNEICETYGCRMGDGASWNGLAHVSYLAATIVSLFIEEPLHHKKLSPNVHRQEQQHSFLELR